MDTPIKFFIKKVLGGLLVVAVLGGTAYLVGAKLIDKAAKSSSTGDSSGSNAQSYQTATGDSCNIAVIPLTDEVFVTADDVSTNGSGTAANDVVASIQSADTDSSIKGIVLQINSPGGSPVGGEMIADALKAASKPTAAVIQDLGDSAAYLAASGADTIIASPMSDVGDIGVTGSFLDYSGSNTKSGNTFVQLSAGKYKDAGNPDKALTADEKALLQSNVDETYKTLVAEVARNRSLSTSTVQTLADGAGYPGTIAIGKKLIDSLGDMASAEAWMQDHIGNDTAVLCQ